MPLFFSTFFLLAITVNFIPANFVSVSFYVYEDEGVLRLQLMLSNPSSFNETVQVISTDVTAIGMLNYICTYIGNSSIIRITIKYISSY